MPDDPSWVPPEEFAWTVYVILEITYEPRGLAGKAARIWASYDIPPAMPALDAMLAGLRREGHVPIGIRKIWVEPIDHRVTVFAGATPSLN